MTARVSLPLPFAGFVFVAGVAITVTFQPTPGDPPFASIGAGLTVGAAAGLAVALLTRQPASLVLVVALALGVGFWRGAAALAGQAQPWGDAPAGPMRFSAVVQSVEERGSFAHIRVRVEEIASPEEAGPPNGFIRLTVPARAPHEPGDLLDVTGRVAPVESTSRDGRRMLSQGIVATSSYPRIIPNGQAPQNLVEATLRGWRAAIKGAVERALPEPHASLLTGLLVGGSPGTPDDFREALIASGTTHIVVVSGFNITLVAGAILTAGRPLGRWGMLAAFAGVWLFVLVAGGTSPTLRAALMATISLLALRAGRGRDALLALAITSSALVFVDPMLVTDLSFQLSALATLGLITLQPRVAALLPWLPAAAREPFAATLAAELATLPVITATFHQVSVVSPISNILIAPLIPVATILGAIGVGLMLVMPPLTSVVGLILMAPTAPMVAIIEATGKLPWAMSPVGAIPPLAVVIYGLGLLVWAAAPTPEGRAVRHAVGGSPLLRPLVIVFVSVVAFSSVIGLARGRETPGPLVVTVLDVGHGDAVFVRTPRGQAILIDGGPNPPALLAGIGRRMGLMERSLAVAAVTRSDPEHLTGMIAALDRYPAAVHVSAAGANPSSLEQRWRAAAVGARSVVVDAPTSLTIERDVVMDVFPTRPVPGPPGTSSSPQPSLLIRLRHGAVVLLIASAGTPSEIARAASSGWSVAADALIVPCHGGPNSLDAATVAAVRPSVAVISAGPRNREGAPTREILSLLEPARVFRTDFHGGVELRTDGVSLWVSPDRSP